MMNDVGSGSFARFSPATPRESPEKNTPRLNYHQLHRATQSNIVFSQFYREITPFFRTILAVIYYSGSLFAYDVHLTAPPRPARPCGAAVVCSSAEARNGNTFKSNLKLTLNWLFSHCWWQF